MDSRTFENIRREISNWSQQQIQELFEWIRFFEKLSFEKRQILYQNHGFGNVYHYKILLIFFTELHSILNNENLDTHGMVTAMKTLMVNYIDRLGCLHSAYQQHPKQKTYRLWLENARKEEPDLFNLIQQMEVPHTCLMYHCCYFIRIKLMVEESAKCLMSFQTDLVDPLQELVNSLRPIVDTFIYVRSCQDDEDD